MAMTMSGEQLLPASRETVWEKLNDPEVLKACIPGCETLDVIGENEFQAVATNKIGPVKARFKGKVRLTDIDPPNGYKISGRGRRRHRRLRQGWRDGGAVRQGRRHAADLQRRGADRRQARPTRPAADQRGGQEARRRFLRQIRRRGEIASSRELAAARPLTGGIGRGSSCSCSKDGNERKTFSFEPFWMLDSNFRRGKRAVRPGILGGMSCRRLDDGERQSRHRRCRSPHAAGAVPARKPAAHRHACGLRHFAVRRLRRPSQRHRGEVLHHARLAGGWRQRAHHRGACRAGWPAASDAGGVPREPRPAVRLLHAGHGHDGGRHGQPPGQRPRRAHHPRASSTATSAAAPAITTSSRRSRPARKP